MTQRVASELLPCVWGGPTNDSKRKDTLGMRMTGYVGLMASQKNDPIVSAL